MGDPRLRPYALGDQSVGDLAGGAIEAGIGGLATFIGDGSGVRPLPGVDPDDVGETHDLDGHSMFPLQSWPHQRVRSGGILWPFGSDFKGLIA